MTCVVLVIIALSLGFYAQVDNEKELQKAIAELDKADPKWRLDDILAERRPIPDEQNSALLVLASAKLIPPDWPVKSAIGEDERTLLEVLPMQVDPDQRWFIRLNEESPNQRPPEDVVRELRAELKAVATAVETAGKLADAPRQGRYPITWGKTLWEILLPNVQKPREVTNLLERSAIHHALDGRDREAIDTCRAMVGTATSIGDEPFLISLLVRISCDAAAVSTTERVLGLSEAPPDALLALQARLRAEDSDLDPLLVTCLRAERAVQFSTFATLADRGGDLSKLMGGAPAADWRDQLSPGFVTRMQMRRSRLESLRFMTRSIEIARLPSNEQIQAFDEWDQEARRLVSEGGSHRYVALLLPAVSKVAAAQYRCLANLRCAQLALAAERYRLDKKHWPEKLAALVPEYIAEIPQDPFDGKPLRMARLTDGMIIYSVGHDRADDGGNVIRNSGPKPGTDLGFRLYDPHCRRMLPLPPPEGLGADPLP
jgi:hypothetical protein